MVPLESEAEMKRIVGQARASLLRAWQFMVDGVWDVELTSLSGLRRAGVKTVRVLNLVVKGFIDDQCPLHASSLTFSTLMSVVPVLAVSLALASGLGAGDNFEKWCRSKAHEILEKSGTPAISADDAGRPAAADKAAVTGLGVVPVKVQTQELAGRMDNLIQQVFDSVRNVSFAKLGGIGLLIVIWSVVQVLGQVEASFNKVWGVTASRPIHRKVLDYLSVLIIVPVLAIAASSLPALSAISRYIPDVTGHMTSVLGSVVMQGLVVVSMTTLAFTFMIMFMPNTKVKLRCGLGGGLVAAVLFLIWMQLCILAQIGVAKYSSIYGTFAAVPIVLFWVYLSWQIILVGAETAFALQNVGNYRMEIQAHTASARSRFILALSIIRVAAKSMMGNEPIFEASSFVKEQRLSARLVNLVLHELVNAGLLAELSDRPGFFVLLKSPDSVMVRDVFNIVFGSGKSLESSGLNLGGTIGEIINRTDASLDAALVGFSAGRLAVKP